MWVGDSTEVEVVALDSLGVCPGDTAQVHDVDGPSTPDDSTAHRVTAHFCSGGSNASDRATYQLDLPAWGRGKCKVVALDPADSSHVLESNEVTFNGGVDSPYPPEPTRGTDSSRRPQIDRITPTSAQANVAVTLLVGGANFAPGVQLELQQGRATWPAVSVEFRGPNALSARIQVPDVPGTALDVLVRLRSGAEARLPQGLVVTNAPEDASTTPKFIRPTNANIAHRQIDLFSDRSYQNIYDHVESPEPPYSSWPLSIDDPTYLAVRQTQHGPDSIAIINSGAHNGVLLEHTTCPSWVKYSGSSRLSVEPAPELTG